MRTVIEFTVEGKDRPDLMEKATALYKEAVGDPDAEIPFSATMEMSQGDIVRNAGGEVVRPVSWIGAVTVSLTADKTQ